jgi:predicted XRE-type DNA-binding protein
MHNKTEVNPGDIFNRLKIIEETDKHVYPSGKTRRKFIAQCSCGSPPKTYLLNDLTTGHTKSCGCLDMEQKVIHGMHKSRAYQCWADMKTRCDCKENKYYDYYGGRGIYYCDKWKTFEGFWEDMQDGYSEDLTLNRRNNDEGYFKENCMWDNRNFQGHMKRKKQNTLFKSFGITLTREGTFAARMKVNEKAVYLGSYPTELLAAKAYDDASQMFYGDRPNKTEFTEDTVLLRVQKFMQNINKDLRKAEEHAPSEKLSEQDAKDIRKLFEEGMKQTDIAVKYNISQSTVSRVCRGLIWKTH